MDEQYQQDHVEAFDMDGLEGANSARRVGLSVLRLPDRHNMTSKYTKIDAGCQTDQEMLFDYIMAFLRALEDRLQINVAKQE